MHLSQPALSKLLAEAEELAGQTLFERSHHGVTPTPLGLMMIGRAAAAQRAGRDPRRADGGGQRRVGQGARGRVPGGGSSAGALTVERLQASHPDLRIELREGLEQQLLPPCARVSWIASSGGWWWRARTPTCNARSCTKRPPRRSAASHPLATRSRLGGAELDRYRWVLPSRNAAPGGQRRRAARGAGFPQSRWNQAPSSPSCLLQRTPLVVGHAAAGGALAGRARPADPAAGLAGQKTASVSIMTRRRARRAATGTFSTDARARRRKWCAMRRRSASGLRRRRRRADAAAVARPRPTGAVRRWRRSAAGARPFHSSRKAVKPTAPAAARRRPAAIRRCPARRRSSRTWRRSCAPGCAGAAAGRRPAPRAREVSSSELPRFRADEVIGQAAPEIGDVARGQRSPAPPPPAGRGEKASGPGRARARRRRRCPGRPGRPAPLARCRRSVVPRPPRARAGAARHEVGQRRRQELHQRGHIGPQPHMTARALACSLSSLLKSSKPGTGAPRAAAPGGRRRSGPRPRAAFEQLRAGGLEIRQAPAGRRQARWQWRAP